MISYRCDAREHEECPHTPVTCECECHQEDVLKAAMEVGASLLTALHNPTDWAEYTRLIDGELVKMGLATTFERRAASMGLSVALLGAMRDDDVKHKRAKVITGEADIDLPAIEAGEAGLDDLIELPFSTETLSCHHRECANLKPFDTVLSLGVHLGKKHQVVKPMQVAKAIFEGINPDKKPWLRCDKCDFVTWWSPAFAKHVAARHETPEQKEAKLEKRRLEKEERDNKRTHHTRRPIVDPAAVERVISQAHAPVTSSQSEPARATASDNPTKPVARPIFDLVIATLPTEAPTEDEFRVYMTLLEQSLRLEYSLFSKDD